MNPGQKPVRVVEQQITLVDACPVCRKPIDGTVEVEVRLGQVTLRPAEEATDQVTADADVSTRLRALNVHHTCTAPVTRDDKVGS